MYQFHLTEKAKKVLEIYAQEEAKKLNHDIVTPEHVLLGLLHENESLASRIFHRLKIDTERIKLDLESIMSKVAGAKIHATIPASPRVQKLISRAAEEARSLGHNYIGTEHLLLGIVREGQNTAFNVLSNLGMDIDILRKEIMQILGVGMAETTIQTEETKKQKTPNLDQFVRDLTKLAKENELDKVIGRDEEVARVIQILSRRKKNNPILLGEPGVGKTAIIEGLAEKVVSGDVPDILLNKRVLTLDLSSVVAGTKYRGEFEERLKNIMAEIKKSSNIIIFIDEVHTIIGAGGAEGALDAANILKPALSRGELQCIGATTLNEYKKYIEKDTALARRFQSIIVEEPNVDDTIKILYGIKVKYEEHHKVKYSDDAINSAATLSKRYINDRYLPDKAIDLIDEAGAKARLLNTTKPKSFKDMEEKIAKLTEKKEQYVSEQNYEEAANIRDKIKKIKDNYYKEEEKWKKDRDKVETIINENDIRCIISDMTHIPLNKLIFAESERLLTMEEDLHKSIIGQNEAIQAVARSIRRSRAGLKTNKRPTGSFIFLGPTGVGKTALAKSLAEFLFGESDALIRVDMSDFMEKHNVSRLVGAPPGYVGFDEGGDLTERIRRRPYSVILFDEIEKAHPDVFNMLLQVLEEGQLTDNLGHKVDFSNTVIIMTSNLGSRDIVKGSSLGFSTDEKSSNDMKDFAIDELKKSFNPEFLNRIDEVVVFHTLSKEYMKDILDIMLTEVYAALRDQNMGMDITDDAKYLLIEKGFDKKYGARSLRRAIQKEIEDRISYEILKDNLKEGSIVCIDSKDDEFILFIKDTNKNTNVDDNSRSIASL